MDITPLIPQGTQIIQSYGNGAFRVSNTVFNTAIAVRPDGVTPWAAPETVAALTPGHFEAITAEVILVGCSGDVPFSLRLALRDKNLNVEFMDIGAACRTYNVLMSEGRDVVALLMP
jgi:uncharacterized protein